MTRQVIAAAGAALVVSDTRELAEAVTRLLGDAELRKVMSTAGKAVLDSNRGALDRLLTLVDPLLA